LHWAESRIALVGSLVWFGLIIIISAIARDFPWDPRYSRDFVGPATVTALIGVAVIWIVCLGLPWIASSTIKDTGK
jgi:hypothetical protein